MMLRHSVDFTTWGPTPIAVPERVRFDPEGGDGRIDRVCRGIERANPGLKVATCRLDLSEVDRHGTVLSRHYELTLGKPIKTGGFNVHGRAWVVIKFRPAEREE